MSDHAWREPCLRRVAIGVLAVLTLTGTLLAACGGQAAQLGRATATIAATGPTVSPTATGPAVSLATTVTASSPATAFSPNPLHPAATLTNADTGKTVQIRVGQTIDLSLRAASGFQNWVVAPPNAAVLMPAADPAAAAVRGVTLRAFLAAAAGQTAITATSKPTCTSGQACPQLVQGFNVTVVVGG